MTDDLILEFDSEEEVIKGLFLLDYPAITLSGGTKGGASFYFNRKCIPYLADRVKVSKAKIGNEYYICFRGTSDIRGYALMGNNSISASAAMSAFGMQCTSYKFSGRKAYRIKDGLAVKMYE